MTDNERELIALERRQNELQAAINEADTEVQFCTRDNSPPGCLQREERDGKTASWAIDSMELQRRAIVREIRDEAATKRTQRLLTAAIVLSAVAGTGGVASLIQLAGQLEKFVK